MSAFDFYQRKIGSTVNTNSTGRNYPTLGEKLKSDSDMLMEYTFDRDPQSKVCYIYDYFHDDQLQLKDHMTYENTTKTRIDAKFIIKSYQSIDKDQVEYYLQFRPSQKTEFNEGDELYYFETDYRRKYGNNDFAGLYVDIPDDRGIYRKWMIISKEIANQFPKYLILPINYNLMWIEDNGQERIKRKMWCVLRSQSSYNSGLWTSYSTTTVENQDKGWLPLNSITEKIWYKGESNNNMRVLLGSLTEHPTAWTISKVENSSPLGIQKLTFYQDVFSEYTDYVNLETGEMYADYYITDSSLTPTNPSDSTIPITTNYSKITASTSTIKIAGSYKTLTAKIYDNSDTEITDNYSSANFNWTCSVDDEDLTDTVTWLSNVNYNQIKIKSTDDRNYLGKTLNIKCVVTNGNEIIETTAQFELIV
jgi:hypothetical protein